MNPKNDLTLAIRRYLPRYLGQLRHDNGRLVLGRELRQADLKILLSLMTSHQNSRFLDQWTYDLAMYASVHLRGALCDASANRVRLGLSRFEDLALRSLMMQLGVAVPISPATYDASAYLSRMSELRDQVTVELCDLLLEVFGQGASIPTLRDLHVHQRFHRDWQAKPITELPLYHLQRLAWHNWFAVSRHFGLPLVSRSLLAFVQTFRDVMAHEDTGETCLQASHGKVLAGWQERVLLAMAVEEFLTMIQRDRRSQHSWA